MEFVASITVLKLSHHITGALVHLTCNSPSSDCSQDISAIKFAKLLYSASVEDLEIVLFLRLPSY